jgi:hypothetical protein
MAGPQVRQRIVETWTNQPRTAGFVREYPVAAGLFERIELKRQILIVR